MNIVFDRLSSLEFWRRVYPVGRSLGAPSCNPHVNECVINWQDIEQLLPRWITPDFLDAIGGLVDVLSLEPDSHRKTQAHIARCVKTPLPEGSFFQTANGAFIASPMFILLEMAPLLSTIQLIALADEFCGTYSFDEREESGFRRRTKPLITKSRLQDYLEGVHGARGLKKVRKALPHVVENSASPMETASEMLACLPFRFGGYGLDEFTMNHPVKLTRRAAQIAKKSTCYVDLCYPKLDFGFEFLGVDYHTDAKSFSDDRARINALKEMDYDIIELTNDQLHDRAALEGLFLYAAKKSGKRIRKEYLGFSQQRDNLRQELWAWNKSGGKSYRH